MKLLQKKHYLKKNNSFKYMRMLLKIYLLYKLTKKLKIKNSLGNNGKLQKLNIVKKRKKIKIMKKLMKKKIMKKKLAKRIKNKKR